MDIHLADITLHIDEHLSPQQMVELEDAFRQRDGIISVHFNPEKRHLIVLEYNPEKVSSRDLVAILHYHGLHGELIGL
ncbi:MAG: ATP-binding protein [Gammaproteobacteria bacterium]|nr:ATP-binding protein [Gammaproteobacteria bacterium]